MTDHSLKKMSDLDRYKGFTLIELLVVIAIIVLLSAVGIVSYSSALVNSRDAKRKGDLSEIQAALALYKSANGGYPGTGGAWWGTCSGYSSKSDTGAGGYVPNLAPTYINKLPHDPKEGIANTGINAVCTAAQTCYLYKSDGVDYKLLAHCTVEEPISTSDKYYDPLRPTWAYQISSSGTSYASW